MDYTELPKQPGIYLILCSVNNSIYIGQSINVYSRLREHRYLLKRNMHPNVKMQNVFNYYTVSAFECHLVAVCDQENLDVLEQQMIDMLRIDGINVLNLSLTVNINTNSDSSEAQKKEFCLLSPYNTVINCRGINETSKKYNIPRGALYQLIHRKREFYNGWRAYPPMSERKSQRRQIKLIDPTGNIHTLDGYAVFASKHGLNTASISKLVSGRIGTHKGWVLYTE